MLFWPHSICSQIIIFEPPGEIIRLTPSSIHQKRKKDAKLGAWKNNSRRDNQQKKGGARRVEKSAANLRRKIIFYLRNKRHFSALRPHIFPVGIHSNLFTFVCMKSAIVLWETISLEGCLSGVVFSFRDFSQHFILHSWLSLFCCCCSFVEMVSSSCS